MPIIIWLVMVVTGAVVAWSKYKRLSIKALELKNAHEEWEALDEEAFRHYRLWVEATLLGRDAAAEWHSNIWKSLQPQIKQAREEVRRRQAS